LFEPCRRNTASAIALGVKYLLDVEEIKDEVIFVVPSDHIVFPEEKLLNTFKLAETYARKGWIITFGVVPSRPETGYGYIEAGERIGKGFKVSKFHEKPDLDTAKLYLELGNFYWNSGMFAFSLRTILEEFRKHAPEIYDFITSTKNYADFVSKFSEMPDISIDYAVMEKTDKAVVLPLNVNWSDVGSWDSVYEVLDKDEDGNVKRGKVVSLDTKDSLIFSSKRLVSTIGVDDLLIVETDDVVLITKKGRSQDVKKLVSELKKNPDYANLVEFHTTVFRPWGSYTELERGERYRIKRITVKPGEALSLQRHYHRSEHWIVVKGTAKVILEDGNGNLQEFFVKENESIFVPKTRKHRLINPGKIDLEIIEVQVGEYVEEDDIERFEDRYSRS